MSDSSHVRATTIDRSLASCRAATSRQRTAVDSGTGRCSVARRQQLILSPTWNGSNHLELGAGYQLTRLRFGVRDESADIHLLRFRVRTALDVRASGNAFI